jgi:hypothetical protein
VTTTQKLNTRRLASPDLTAQRDYVQQKKASGFKFGLTVADAFVRGIRDIGYRSTATALDELIDNALQAEAKRVDVAFAFEGGSDSKPSAIAIIDDGHGMDDDMIRLAVTWGGTHRENDRHGFGRYGYGLPSSSVSQGQRFTVYSIVEGGPWNKVTLDLEDLGKGKYNVDGEIVVPAPTPADLPEWLEEYIAQEIGDLTHGTVVLIEKLDRLSWKTAKTLKTHLLNHFGVTYRNFLRQVDVRVDTTRVEPVDPLFTTPGFRFYDLDEDRAVPLEPLTIEVKDDRTGKPVGAVKVRFASLPPTFARKDKLKERSQNNERFAIIKDKIGIIVLRQGRQIDLVSHGCPWTSFNNDDRYWGVEIDFDATLDEEFSITTSKQQVAISDRMWEILRERGVYSAIQQLRKRYDEDKAKLKAIREEQGEKRPSEEIMEDAAKFKTRTPAGERSAEAEQHLEQEARRRAEQTGLPFEEIAARLRSEVKGHPYKVVEESHPGAPFYRVDQVGGQKLLFLNTAHRFYTDVYAGPESTTRLRAALEILLFVMGECELDATDDRKRFYETERVEWSIRLTPALDLLNQADNIRDARIRVEQMAEDEMAATAPTEA